MQVTPKRRPRPRADTELAGTLHQHSLTDVVTEAHRYSSTDCGPVRSMPDCS
jgi:hypothetical protein